MQSSSPPHRRRPASPLLATARETWPDATPRPAPATTDDPAETARYIAQMTSELAALAGAAQLETLAYLLAMARVEADVAARS